MNTLLALNVDYLRPSRTIETILISNKISEKVVFVYNYEGNSFRVFDNVITLINFFESNLESKYHFNSEIELDKFLSTIELNNLNKK